MDIPVGKWPQAQIRHSAEVVQGEKSERPPIIFAIPDLNTIENLWDGLERRVKDIWAQNSDEKFAILSREWYKTDRCTIDLLMASMPNRCEEAIKSRGFLLAIELILLFYQLLLS